MSVELTCVGISDNVLIRSVNLDSIFKHDSIEARTHHGMRAHFLVVGPALVAKF